MLRSVHPLLGLAALALAAAVPAAGQVIVTGVVRDSASGRPLEEVEILVEGSLTRAVSDTAGRYLLRLEPSRHTLLVRRIGYLPLVLPLDTGGMQTLRLNLALRPAPQQLPGVETVAPASSAGPAGFEERRNAGLGHFLTEALLRRSEHRRLSDLIRAALPSVRLRQVGERIVATGRGSGWCPMAIWLDGVRIYAPTAQETSPFLAPRRDAPDLNEWQVNQLQAVEVYSLSETPAEFSGSGSSCGSILLWTRIR